MANTKDTLPEAFKLNDFVQVTTIEGGWFVGHIRVLTPTAMLVAPTEDAARNLIGTLYRIGSAHWDRVIKR